MLKSKDERLDRFPECGSHAAYLDNLVALLIIMSVARSAINQLQCPQYVLSSIGERNAILN